MKVIVSMSGMSSRFSAAGYKIPKYLIEISGKKVIEHIVELYPQDTEFVFIINEKHKEETNIVEILDIILFKGKSHLKRFIGITILTKKLFTNFQHRIRKKNALDELFKEIDFENIGVFE